MSEGLLIALVTAIIGLIAGVVLKLAEKFFSKAKDQADADESRAAGLRVDLERKDQELTNLKTELKEIDEKIDKYKILWWNLFDDFMKFRSDARAKLLSLGIPEADVESFLPDIPTGPLP